MKKIKIRVLAMIISIAMIITMLPYSTFAAAKEEVNTSYQALLETPTEVPKEFTDLGNVNPYGYGLNEPFTLTTANELLVHRSYDADSSDGHVSYKTYWGLQLKNNFSGANGDITQTEMSHLDGGSNKPFSNTGHTLSSKKAYMYTKAVAFDPTNTGKDDHVAYIAYDYSEKRIVVYVMNTETGVTSSAYHAGYAYNFEGKMEQHEANGFLAITAGRYQSGNGGETFVTYSPLSNGNYCLKEWSVSIGSDDAIYLKSEKSDRDHYLHEMYRQTDIGKEMAQSNELENLLGVSLATGDFNNDNIDDLAVLSYVNDVKSKYKEINPMFFSPYLTLVKGGGSESILMRTSNIYSTYVENYDTEKHEHQTMTAPSVTAGDVNGDGYDEVIAAGWRSVVKTKDNANEKTSSHKIEDGVAIGVYGYTNAGGKTINFMINDAVANEDGAIVNTWSHEVKKHFDEDFNNQGTGKVVAQYIVECVALNGPTNAEFLFMNGTICSYNEGEVSAVYTPEYFQHVDDPVSGLDSVQFGFVSSVAVGAFDRNPVGREQVIVSVAMKEGSSDDHAYMLGLIGGKGYEDTASSYGVLDSYYSTAFDRKAFGYNAYDYGESSDYPINNKGSNTDERLNYLVVAIDCGNDSTVARYVGKKLIYSEPNLITVLQAAPRFGELGYYGGSTSYNMTTSLTEGKMKGKSTSLSVGMSTEVEGPGIKVAVGAGYTRDWSESFEQSLTKSYTVGFDATEHNQVILQRTPIVVYCYETRDRSTGEWITKYKDEKGNPAGTLQITSPLKAAYTSLTVEKYNEFVEVYNASKQGHAGVRLLKPISTTELLQNVGNPNNYFKNWDDSDKDRISSDYDTGEGSTVQRGGYSEETAETKSKETADGYYVDTSIGSGASFLLGSVYAGVDTSVSGSVTHGSYTTTSQSTEVEGAVADPGCATDFDESLTGQYGFRWSFGTWRINLYESKGTSVPVYGYAVSQIRSAPAAPKNLVAKDGEDETKIALSWDAAQGAAGYNVYRVVEGAKKDEYEYEKVNSDLVTGTSFIYNIPTEDRELSFRFVVAMVSITASAPSGVEGNYSNIAVYHKQMYALSAYDIAVKNGFVGTEEEWLQSLIGAPGKDGVDGTNGADGQDGQDGADGADGRGIEDIYIDADTKELIICMTDGTKITLGAIHGKDGADGADGQDGADGVDGQDGVGISKIEINAQGELIVTMTKGNPVNLGVVVGKDGADGTNGKDGKDGVDGADGQNGKDGINGTDGKDGINGVNGADGKDGVNGTNGTNGTNATTGGSAGKDGVGIKDIKINEEGEFIFTMTDGSTINAGAVPEQEKDAPVSAQVDSDIDVELQKTQALATAAIAISGISFLWNMIAIVIALINKKKTK